MRTLLLLLFTLLLFSYKTKKAKTKKEIHILFIGNILVDYNNMPQILQKMLDTQEKKYDIAYSAYTGISLSQHFIRRNFKIDQSTIFSPLGPDEISDTEKLILSKSWDYVVLQDYVLPDINMPENKIINMVPAILDIQKKFKSQVSQFILFKTWPNTTAFPKQFGYPKMVYSLDEETAVINYMYDSIALATHITSVSITNCFTDINKHHRRVNLYDGPYMTSIYGAYLNACIFFKCFTKQNTSPLLTLLILILKA